MAISYTVPNTFFPSTRAESAKVNANETYTKSVFDGLESTSLSFAKLKVDADPASALEVATKQYVDNYSSYRRPNLQWSSVSVVNVESGLNGTSGEVVILFPDGTKRTETSTTRTSFNITRNAVFSTTSGAQSGLRSSLSEASNTWYALYAVKVTDSSTQWCTVGDTVLPIQSNYSTLNSNFGSNSWVYLGMIRNGDNASSGSDILDFIQSGNTTQFRNISVGDSGNIVGHVLAKTSGAVSSLTWSYAAGTGAAQIPNHILIGRAAVSADAASSGLSVQNSAANSRVAYAQNNTTNGIVVEFSLALTMGIFAAPSASTNKLDIVLRGYFDSVLGVGSNPVI